MRLYRIASNIVKRRLYVGERSEKHSDFIPGFMSVNPWQAMQYGKYIYTVDINLRTLGPEDDKIWGLDRLPDHPFFKETPGVFDPRYGEAIVNVPIPPVPVTGKELVEALKTAPDFESHHECMLENRIEDLPDMFGGDIADFVVWYLEKETGGPISEINIDEARDVFDESSCLNDDVERALMSIRDKFGELPDQEHQDE